MIIKGGAAGNVGFWTRHLLRDDTNDTVRLIETSGVIATTLNAALREMQAIAAQSRCRGNFLYQANINPRVDEDLSHAQMKEAVERLERNLCLAGHQRVIVEHVKHRRRHWHALWNRVDVETLKVTDVTGNYAVHAKTARELERVFGLSPTPSPDGKHRSKEKLWERRAEEETGITRALVSADMTRCWDEALSGRGFRAAIERLGYRLARGDRRDYCVLDRSGRVHSLARRLVDIDAGAIRERLANIDPATLPSVAEARAWVRAENPGIGRARTSSSRPDVRFGFIAARRQIGKRQSKRARMRREATSGAVMLASFRVARKIAAPRVSIRRAQQLLRRAPTPIIQRAGTDRPAHASSPLPLPPSTPANSRAILRVKPSRPGTAHFDTTVYGRAEAAAAEESGKWQAQIEATQVDPSLTADQRIAAIASLRQQQQLAVKAIRQRIIEEEKQRVQAAKRIERANAKEQSPRVR